MLKLWLVSTANSNLCCPSEENWMYCERVDHNGTSAHSFFPSAQLSIRWKGGRADSDQKSSSSTQCELLNHEFAPQSRVIQEMCNRKCCWDGRNSGEWLLAHGGLRFETILHTFNIGANNVHKFYEIALNSGPTLKLVGVSHSFWVARQIPEP